MHGELSPTTMLPESHLVMEDTTLSYFDANVNSTKIVLQATTSNFEKTLEEQFQPQRDYFDPEPDYLDPEPEFFESSSWPTNPACPHHDYQSTIALLLSLVMHIVCVL